MPGRMCATCGTEVPGAMWNHHLDRDCMNMLRARVEELERLVRHLAVLHKDECPHGALCSVVEQAETLLDAAREGGE